MLKDTKSLDNNKAPACESRGFVHKKKEGVHFDTPPLFISYTRKFTIFANNQMIFMESPTNRIKEVLTEKGIKQTWLAEKLGKSFTIVNSYVCNRRQPSLELLFQIAEILQVNPKDLINTPDDK